MASGILLTGASGFIGRRLCEHFKKQGRKVVRLLRASPKEKYEHYWNPEQEILDAGAFDGVDVVVNLSGSSIFGRWTQAKKRGIIDSRVGTVKFLGEKIARLDKPPELFISASATGYYGYEPGSWTGEEGAKGTGFLADVCSRWEEAADGISAKGVRVVHPRFGIVLGKNGGTLGKMLPLFKMNLGGKLGDGSQPMSWIALREIAPVVDFIIKNEGLTGPVNVVSPTPATNAGFTEALARVLKKKAFFNVPEFVLRIAFGEMAEELLLGGARVLPQKLLSAGYRFIHEDLEKFLAEELSVS